MTDFFNSFNLKSIIDSLPTYTGFSNPVEIIKAIIDIGIVAYVIYNIILLFKETRAWQLLKGILVILGAALLSDFLGLKTIAFLLNNTIQYIAIALIVIFQPELRRGLERLGRSNLKDVFAAEQERDLIKTTAVIEEIVKAVGNLAEKKTGALIVIERETKLGEIIKTGVELESKLSAELLANIFTPLTPLHDGAVIIRSNLIQAASCFLPLTDNPNLGKELGTRHRAALGITEISDCLAIVVSEETGSISFAINGIITRNMNQDSLRKALNKNLLDKVTSSRRIYLWRGKSK